MEGQELCVNNCIKHFEKLPLRQKRLLLMTEEYVYIYGKAKLGFVETKKFW